MDGNVNEWCQDWYGENYYIQSPDTDPHGPTSGSGRVYRGGGWLDIAANCRSARRTGFKPVYSGDNLGLRLVRIPMENTDLKIIFD